MRARAKRVGKWLRKRGVNGMYGVQIVLARRYVYIYCRYRLLVQIDKVSYYENADLIRYVAMKVCREDDIVKREVK